MADDFIPVNTDDIQSSNNGQRPILASDRLITTVGGTNYASIFVRPGQNTEDLLMRTFLRDERQAIHYVRFLSKCNKYGFERGKQDLRNLAAAKCSIQGRSTAFALMGIVQAISPEALLNFSRASAGRAKNMIYNKRRPEGDALNERNNQV